MSNTAVRIDSPKFKNRIDLFCMQYYGRYNDALRKAVVDANPHIDFFTNGLNVGDTVYLPALYGIGNE